MAMQQLRSPIGFLFVAMMLSPCAHADGMRILQSPLVDHPVLHPSEGRSAYVWRSSAGRWGENLAQETLRLRGFNEIHEIKINGNQGIDRIAIKRGTDGSIKEVKFVEVKTTRSPKPRLGHTQYGGQQLSRKWLAENLKRMRNSGNPELRKLATELGRFRRSSGLPLESMGELMHVNTKTGRLIGYAGDGKTVKYDDSIERMLKRIQRRGSTAEVRASAVRHLSGFDQVKAASESSWLGRSAAKQSERAVLSSSLGKSAAKQSERAILRSAATGTNAVEAAALVQGRRVLVKKVILRSAGPIAMLASVAADTKELYDTESAYRSGAISERQRTIQMLTTLGGAVGVAAGASSGAAAGAWIGAFGGPVAWITIPAGGIVGGVIGGIGGYFGGSSAAGYGATSWYHSIDEAIRYKAELAWLSSRAPVD